MEKTINKAINILFFVYFAIFPFGQLTKIPLGIPEVNLYLTDMVAGVLGIFGVLGLLRAKKLPALAKPIFIFLLTALVSLLVNTPRLQTKEFIVASFYFLRLAAYSGLFFVAYQFRKKFLYTNYLIVVGTAIAIFGLIQYIFLPDIGFLEIYNYDPHYYRLVGTFLDPGFTGIILVLTLILLYNSQLDAIRYPLYAICYLALALTYSRASYLAFAVAISIIALKRKSLKFLTAIIFIIFLTIMVLPRYSGGEGVKLARTATAIARIGSWKNALAIFKKYPLFGVGFNTYRYAQRDFGFLGEDWQKSNAGAGADSSLLFVMATTGVLGVLGLLGLLGKILRLSFRKSLLVFTSLIALLIHSWFLNSLFYPSVMGWMAFILALL